MKGKVTGNWDGERGCYVVEKTGGYLTIREIRKWLESNHMKPDEYTWFGLTIKCSTDEGSYQGWEFGYDREIRDSVEIWEIYAGAPCPFCGHKVPEPEEQEETS